MELWEETLLPLVGLGGDEPTPFCGQMDLQMPPLPDMPICRLDEGHDGDHDDRNGHRWPHPAE